MLGHRGARLAIGVRVAVVALALGTIAATAVAARVPAKRACGAALESAAVAIPSTGAPVLHKIARALQPIGYERTAALASPRDLAGSARPHRAPPMRRARSHVVHGRLPASEEPPH